MTFKSSKSKHPSFIGGGGVKPLSLYCCLCMVAIMGIAMTMVPINQLSAQNPIEVDWHPESLISSSPPMKVINGVLSLPRCEEQGYAAIGFTTESSFEVKNPNYDPLDDQNETTLVNSYLIVMSRTQEGLDPDIKFFDIVAPDGVYGDFSTELLGSKTFEWSVGGSIYYHSFFFKVDHTVTVPNHVFEDVSDFGGFPIEARFYHEGLNRIIWSSAKRFYLYSGSMVGFDIEDYQEFSDVADLTYLGQRTSEFSAETHVLIDGTVTPQKLSDYVSTELEYFGDPPLLAHPAVACYQEEGSGISNILMVEGDLIVDIDYCYFHRLNTKHIDPDPLSNLIMKYIYMGPDARIFIDSGVVFTIDRTLILSCNTLWNSIVVEDGGTLNIHESYIMDGIHAIKVEEGGTVNISNNIFDANHVSFYTPPKGSPGRYSITMGPFYGNEFVNINELKTYPAGYSGLQTDQPYAAIQLNDLNMFIASGIGKLGEVKKNTIHDIPFGIFAENSGVSIKNYHIKNAFITGGYGGYGIVLDQSSLVYSSIVGNGKNSNEPNIENATNGGIYIRNGLNSILNNVIENTEMGVRVDYDRFTLTAINNNNIDASLFGILNNAGGSGRLNIIDNEITMGRTSAPPFGGDVMGLALFGIGLPNNGAIRVENNTVDLNDYSKLGMYVYNLNHTRLRENTITDQIATPGFLGISLINSAFTLMDYNSTSTNLTSTDDASGIVLEHSPISRINCNNTETSRYGIHVIGVNDATELKGNQIGIHHYGILYGFPGVSPHNRDNHFTGLQIHHGNEWDSWYHSTSAGSLGALHQGKPMNVSDSQFRVDDGISSYTTTRDPYGWFIEEPSGGNTWQCPDPRPENPFYDYQPRTEPTELDDRIAKDDKPFDGQNFETSVTYISRRNLYYRIQEGYYASSALTGTSLDTFMTEMQNTGTETLFNLSQTLAEEIELNPQDLEYLELLTDTLKYAIAELIAIDSLAWIDTSSVDTTQWLLDRQAPLDEINRISEDINDFNSLHEPDKDGVVSSVISALNELPDSIAPESMEKQMLGLIAQTVYKGDWDFSGNQRNKIIEISEYCPAYGGTAVYWARNLRRHFEPGVDFNDTLCSPNLGLRIIPEIEKEETSSVLIYPNPATHTLNVDLGGVEYTDWRIYGTDGRLIRQGRTETENRGFTLNVQWLKSGQYYLYLKGKESESTTSFIIQNNQ